MNLHHRVSPTGDPVAIFRPSDVLGRGTGKARVLEAESVSV